MKKIVLAALSVGAALITLQSADAAGGCGPAFHRGPYGGCRRNFGPRPALAGPVLGVFYPGHGYWDGHRYWGHRYRFHGGWRYR